MVKIIFKKGRKGEMKLSAIEGIAVPRLDGKIALVYPRVNKLPLLNRGYTVEWGAPEMSEIDALYADFSIAKARTDELLDLGSPAAEFVRSFGKEFNLADLLDVSAIHKQREQINELACKIEDADIIPEDVNLRSCLRFNRYSTWYVDDVGFFINSGLGIRLSVLPVAHL